MALRCATFPFENIQAPLELRRWSRVKKPTPIKVLLASEDNLVSRRFVEYLIGSGFDAQMVTTGKEARSEILRWRPRFVLADMMLSDGGALSLIDFIKTESSLRHQFIHVLVISGHNTEANVRQALDRGAKDYIVKPFRFEDLVKRLVFHARSYRQVQQLTTKDSMRVDEASLMLHLTDLVLKQALGGGRLEEILHNLTRMVTMRVDGVRCSVVHVLGLDRGVVVTSNDDRKASGIILDLNKYPEITHVMNTQSLIAVENIKESVELRSVQEKVRDISFNSIIVCPLRRSGQVFGVLSLRMPPEKETVSDNEIRFVEIVSHVVSLVLGGEIHKESNDFWLKDTVDADNLIPLRQVKNT